MTSTQHEPRTRVINVTPTASAKGLREKLESEAQRRGLNFRQFIGDIYTYAVANRGKFSGPLSDARSRGGAHIGAVVSERTAKALTAWAKERKTSRGEHCRYVLEKALEDAIIAKAVEEAKD